MASAGKGMTSDKRRTAVAVCVVAVLVSTASATAVAQIPSRPTSLRVDVQSDRDSGTVVGHASSVRDLVIDIASRSGFVLLDAERIPADPIDVEYVEVPLQVIVRNLLSDAGVNFLMAGHPDRLVPARVLIVGRTAATSATASVGTPTLAVTGEAAVPPARGASAVRSILGDQIAEEPAGGAALAEPPPPADPSQPARAEAGSWSAAETRPAPYEVRPVQPEEVMMPTSQGAIAPPIPGLPITVPSMLQYAVGSQTPGQAVPAVAVTPEVTLPSGVTFGASGAQSSATGVPGTTMSATGGTPDPATAQLLMPGFKGPQLMTGPPPGTPALSGTPTPPKTTPSPIIK
jgi:hypothetical protein